MIIGKKSLNHPQQIRVRGARDDVDDRRTPTEIFEPLHREYCFTLDAAASLENAKLPNFFSLMDDGLKKSWGDNFVWCNPPYSDLTSWVRKAVDEVADGNCPLVVMLLPNNRCEQRFWQDHIEPRRDGKSFGNVRVKTRFIQGRPRFGRPDSWEKPKKGDRPPFGLVVVIFEKEKKDG